MVETIEFGSSNNKSDTDLVHIIKESTHVNKCIYSTINPLQYKDIDNNIDHIYISASNFLKCIVEGHNVIFHKILKESMFKKDSIFAPLAHLPLDHTSIQRAYCGMAKRDISDSLKSFDKDKRRSFKKLKFAIHSINMINTMRHIKPLDRIVIKNKRHMVETRDRLYEIIDLLRKKIELSDNKDNSFIDTDDLIEIEYFINNLKVTNYGRELLPIYRKVYLDKFNGRS